MIRKLQRRFILIATFAVAVLLIITLGAVNLVNWNRGVREAREVLGVIIGNGGTLPEASELRSNDSIDFEPEMSFQTRYFSVRLDSSYTVKEVNTEHIAAISDDEAQAYAERIASTGRSHGVIKTSDADYYYRMVQEDNGDFLIVTLDSTRYLRTAMTFAHYSLQLGILCTLIYMAILTLLSRRLIRPIIRNMENQKQFITNAGHELKTPIAVISANAEVLEMINGKNEWTESILNQSKRLTSLVNKLISLAKLGEKKDITLTTIDMSGIVESCGGEFRTVASQQGKTLTVSARPGITVKAEEHSLQELVNILADNAVKYCDDGGTIDIGLDLTGFDKTARLVVSNDYADGKNADYSRFFDRFYRGDTSHNCQKSGYGIGLSMAQGIVKLFGGKIGVNWKDGRICFTVTLPALKTEKKNGQQEN